MAEQDGRDGGRVGGRIRRYARVTSTMTGLAARMAGERYLVGERGPEVFTPGQSGAVSPLGGAPPPPPVACIFVSPLPGQLAMRPTVDID